MNFYPDFFKPILDFILACLGLLILSPIFLISLLVLTIANGGKAFFFQQRPGKDELIFEIIKFKTMNDKKDEYGNLLPPSQRLTKVGIFFRKYSIDEIPQLINVIKGDMSLIGPRPLLKKYLGLYNDFQKHRHDVKPGVTGWAQVNGRNAISWEEKFEYDVWYVRNISFLLDLKIIALTIYKVLKRTGINTKDDGIMPDFTGTKSRN